MRVFKILGIVFTTSMLAYSPLSLSAGIKKCQDENGMWHYGDFADQACGNTDVTKLNSQGSVVGVEKPPPTQEELDKKNDAKKAAADLANKKKVQRKHDQSIVQIYGSADIIKSTRDRKLESIDNNLVVTRTLKAGIEADLAELEKRETNKKVKKLIKERVNAIQSYERVINESLLEREKLETEYADILMSFQRATARLNAGS